MEFEWDPAKNEKNIQKHGIDFEDAAHLFRKRYIEERSDREDEERWKATGEIHGRLVTVIYTMRGERLRIISARRARQNERRAYRQVQP